MPRFYCPEALATHAELDLPAGAARHVQVLRLQPGDTITLFNQGPGWDGLAAGGEFEATITHMGRTDVRVRVGAHSLIEREARRTVHLAVGMPANDRMDWLVEKASELGVASIQPLLTSRSVLRLDGERAEKKRTHWQGIAVSACEQCGGNRVPTIHPVLTLAHWLAAGLPRTEEGHCDQRLLLSLRAGSVALQTMAPNAQAALFLSGPEGGLSAAEEDAAIAVGFSPVSLGARVLRAETAALAALTLLA